MVKISRGIAAGCAAVAFALGAAANAEATIIADGTLFLDTDPTLIFGQTASSPCVIGGNNCQNGAFLYTLQGSGGSGETDDRLSPVYSYATIFGVVGSNNFTVALDYNQADDPQTLNLFEAIYCPLIGSCTTQTFDIPTSLPTNNNGVGFSDFLITGFAIPGGTSTIQFHANWFNNDGADRYFLIGANAPPVPEPASMALFGIALMSGGWRFRRKFTKA